MGKLFQNVVLVLKLPIIAKEKRKKSGNIEHLAWLASVPCVHRDLACRNVLITKTKIIRIADFGLTKKFASKSYYRLKTETRLPIPTMSPEAIDDLKFTEKSDVWSFGLCLYEIFTLGGTPYPNCGSIQEIIEFIENGNRNVQPKYCPDEIYKLMELCWKTSPKKRPTFKKCVKVFKDYMQKEVVQIIERNLQLEREEQQELDSWIGKSLKKEEVEDKETEVLDKL